MAKQSSDRAAGKSEPLLGCAMTPAVIEAVGEDPGRVQVRLAAPDRRAELIWARLAVSHRLSPGDRVLVLSDAAQTFVVGVLHAARQQIALPDGGHVALADGAVELRDAEDRLLIRYDGGSAEVCAPAGDLTLAAPRGHVRLSSALDVVIEAERDVQQRACRQLGLQAGADRQQVTVTPTTTTLENDRLELKANDTEVTSGRVAVVANHIANTAKRLANNVGRYELTADRIAEKSREAFRDVAGLLQLRVGRARQIVKRTFTLHSRRTVMVSQGDTSIDGKKIRLG